ncbi:MAG: peroxiredoxin [Pseudomonadota bacterium]
MTVTVGDIAPDFSLPANGGDTITLSAFKGQYVVLFFYPKDDTSGCTKECIAFSDYREKFDALNIKLIGLSKDSVKSHDKFIAKHNLNIDLVADEDCKTLEAYGAWVEKSMYGKKYMGAERSTFIIDPEGKIAKLYRKVKVPGHVEAIYDDVQALACVSE